MQERKLLKLGFPAARRTTMLRSPPPEHPAQILHLLGHLSLNLLLIATMSACAPISVDRHPQGRSTLAAHDLEALDQIAARPLAHCHRARLHLRNTLRINVGVTEPTHRAVSVAMRTSLMPVTIAPGTQCPGV